MRVWMLTGLIATSSPSAQMAAITFMPIRSAKPERLPMEPLNSQPIFRNPAPTKRGASSKEADRSSLYRLRLSTRVESQIKEP